MKRQFALLLVALTFGCHESPTTAPAVPGDDAPRFDFSNAPDDLTNVVRWDAQFAWWIASGASGVRVWAGLPDDPRVSTLCAGGTEPPDVLELQRAGDLVDMAQTLGMAGDINIHVYPLTAAAICRFEPIARGVGRFMYVDNNGLSSEGFPGRNTWTYMINGTVEFTDGTRSHVLAQIRWMANPDGTAQIILFKIDFSAP